MQRIYGPAHEIMVRDDKPSAYNTLFYLSLYKVRFEKSSFKKDLSEMLSFEHMNHVAENFIFI